MNRTRQRWVVGVDAGGSKTIAWLARLSFAGPTTAATWEQIGQGMAGSANVVQGGPASAAKAIHSAIEVAMNMALSERRATPAGDVAAAPMGPDLICVGAAGAAQPARAERLHAALQRLRPGQAITVHGDVDLVLAAAARPRDVSRDWLVGERADQAEEPLRAAGRGAGPQAVPVDDHRPVVAVICGTGSVVVGQGTLGERIQCGGWGARIGDLGSGAWIGQQALQAACRAADRCGPSTALLDRWRQQWRVTHSRELAAHVADWSTPSQFAVLALDVCELAAEDAVAQQILAAAAEHLATQTTAVLRQLNPPPESMIRLALAGSLLTRSTILTEKLLQNLAEESQTVRTSSDWGGPPEVHRREPQPRFATIVDGPSGGTHPTQNQGHAARVLEPIPVPDPVLGAIYLAARTIRTTEWDE